MGTSNRVQLEVDLENMEENIEKAKELIELLEKANSLADELAKIDLVKII